MNRQVALLLCAAVVHLSVLPARPAAQVPDPALVQAMRNVYQLRSYTAFDWISGSYQKGTLTLQGMVRTGQLKQQAEEAARKVSTVEEVVNEINLLPSHVSDDNVRIAAYLAIYASGGLERYAPAGQLSPAAISELQAASRFGLEGVDVGRGPHAIHILVSAGRVILRGEVRASGDRQIAEASVRTTPGVLSVTNQIRVAGQQ